MAQLVSGKASQKEVALRLEVSVCPAKRLRRSYVETGVSGLISKKRGQPSNRRIAQDVLAQAVRLIGTHYADFGPTIAAEKLREQHGVPLSVEAVRKLIMEHGHWKVRRTRTVRVHQMLDRRGQRGELIQIDGSPHDWFEGRSPRCCLLVFIDDATGELCPIPWQGGGPAAHSLSTGDALAVEKLTCQYEGALLQIKTASSGLSLRGMAGPNCAGRAKSWRLKPLSGQTGYLPKHPPSMANN